MAAPLLDTNVLLRHLLNDHAKHSPLATAYLRRIEAGEIRVHINDIVVFETVYVLEGRGQSRRAVRDLVLALIELPAVMLPGKHRWRRVFERYVDAKLPIADAYHTVFMEQIETAEIVSFDKDFDCVAGLKRVEPS